MAIMLNSNRFTNATMQHTECALCKSKVLSVNFLKCYFFIILFRIKVNWDQFKI